MPPNVPPLLVSCELRERLFSTKVKIFQRKIDNRLKQKSQLRETAVTSWRFK
jgi:hypothetical protein